MERKRNILHRNTKLVLSMHHCTISYIHNIIYMLWLLHQVTKTKIDQSLDYSNLRNLWCCLEHKISPIRSVRNWYLILSNWLLICVLTSYFCSFSDLKTLNNAPPKFEPNGGNGLEPFPKVKPVMKWKFELHLRV